VYAQLVGRFAKFKTRKWVTCHPLATMTGNSTHHSSRGRKVTSLGVLFDFTGNDHNTTVQKVEDMVKEAWVRHVPLSIPLSRAHASAPSLLMQSTKSLTSSSLLGKVPSLPDHFIGLTEIDASHMPVALDNCGIH
jgi:hypothetical protein